MSMANAPVDPTCFFGEGRQRGATEYPDIYALLCRYILDGLNLFEAVFVRQVRGELEWELTNDRQHEAFDELESGAVTVEQLTNREVWRLLELAADDQRIPNLESARISIALEQLEESLMRPRRPATPTRRAAYDRSGAGSDRGEVMQRIANTRRSAWTSSLPSEQRLPPTPRSGRTICLTRAGRRQTFQG
jgi:hypothetical protein